MKWILLLAIIPIIQNIEVAGRPPIFRMIFRKRPIKHNTAVRNKWKSPEDCYLCDLHEIIKAVDETIGEKQQTVNLPRQHETSYGEPFKDILLARPERSPSVELTRYLSNSFNDSLARIKEKFDVLERHYELINEISQKVEVNEEKEHETDQISLTEQSRKYKFYCRLFSNPFIANSVWYYLTKEFDDDIDYIKNNLGLLTTDYERVINDLKNIAIRKKDQHLSHMFMFHWSLFDEPIKDMIQFRSTRSLSVTKSFNNVLASLRITLDSLGTNYEYIIKLLQKAEANEEKGEQTDQISLIEESSKYSVRNPWMKELSELPRRIALFHRDMVDIENNLRLLKINYNKINYERVIDHLRKISDVREANSQEDKKDPSPSESIVSNNNTQENVTQTIPTPDKSTNTQKPVPTEHDDIKDKLVGEKDPLHTPEIAPNNKTPENIIIPIESTIIENLELTTIKNEDYFEQFEQEAKKDTFASIKNDSNEKVEPSITVDKEILINPFNPKDSIALEELRKLLLEKD